MSKLTRSMSIDVAEGLKVEGVAVVFNEPTEIYEADGTKYTEIINRSAFNKTDMEDVQLYVNHKTDSIPLARTPKTMSLEVTETAVLFRAVLPNTDEGKSIHEAIRRGDLKGCSFGFVVAPNGDTYDSTTKTRTITDVSKLLECSIVTHPAYEMTSVEARSQNQNKGANTMKFESIEEVFNHYKNTNPDELQARMEEINKELEQASDEDKKELELELAGIQEVLKNQEEKRGANMQNFNIVTGTNFNTAESIKRSNNVFDTAEYRSAFFKTLKGDRISGTEKLAWEKAQAETRAAGTMVTDAAVIPTQTLNEVISKARKQGGVLAACRNFDIPSNLAVPVGTPGARAKWHTEGTAVDGENPDVTSVKFEANEILKVFSISTAVKTMSVEAFEQYLIEELTSAVMGCLEDAVINGTGKQQGKGLESIKWTKGTNLVEASKAIKYADVIEAVAKLPRGYAQNGKFAMNNATLYRVFYGMVDATDRPIFIADAKADTVGKILGFEVIVDDNIKDNDIYFGNFDYMGYNLPNGIAVEASTQSSFRSGLVDYRALAVADCKPIVDEAFIKLAIAAA